MLPPQKVIVKWQRRNKTHYINCGYKFTQIDDEFEVDVFHLTKGNKSRIKIICDYCGKSKTQVYKDYIKTNINGVINKDSCTACMPKKLEESLLVTHGVTNASYLDEVNEKRKEIYKNKSEKEKKEMVDKQQQTMYERFGVYNPLHSEEIKERSKETNKRKYGKEHFSQTDKYKESYKRTCLEKYGVEHYSKTDEYKTKFKETCLNRYGVFSPLQNYEIKMKVFATNLDKYGFISPLSNLEIQNKISNTNLIKYGVKNPIQNAEIKEAIRQTNLSKYGVENPFESEIIRKKIEETNIKNIGVPNPFLSIDIQRRIKEKMVLEDKIPTSTQQRYINYLLNGTLNYLVNITPLDIAFPDEMIYCEYDGSGHTLSIYRNNITEEEFKLKEIRRSYALKKLGWREIRILSKKDKLPSDEILISMLEIAKEYLDTGRSWIHFDIDNSLVKCSQFEKHFDFGTLRRIKQTDLLVIA